MLVRHWMTSDVVSVTPETSLLKCKKIFQDHLFSALPVLDAEGRVVGLLAAEDLREFAPRSHTGYEVLERINSLWKSLLKTLIYNGFRILLFQGGKKTLFLNFYKNYRKTRHFSLFPIKRENLH